MKYQMINSNPQNSNCGFTLVEIVVGIFAFTVLSLGLVALVSNILVSSSKQSNLLADADQARQQAFGIINQLRNAQTSSTGAYPLEIAGDQALTFYSNVDNNPFVERVRYYVQDGKLYRGITKPAGNPLAYDPANEKISVVQNNLANGSSPLFYYYDGSYNGMADNPLAQPVSVTAVKFVKLDLKVFNKAGLDGTNFYSVTAGGSIRSLKDNLGEGAWTPGTEFQLTTQVSPGVAGSVAVSPAGPNYPAGSLVNINAIPVLGYAFSDWNGDVENRGNQATTIVMDSNKTVTADFSSVPQTLTGSIYAKGGSSQSNQKWSLLIHNTKNYYVNDVNLYSFSLAQTAGTACSPALVSPASFPAFIGDLSSGGSRNYDVRINFSGCPSSARFTVSFSFAGNGVADWGSAIIYNQAQQ